ncbi:MAG: phthalate 4,5-dioxygenase [Noviherbaspirillum sp.]|nr:phthalate 4,5-dioxygenase [Noviherbaspirillum sp.]
MLSQQENELLVRTGPGTPGGEMMRSYWQPVALAADFPPDCAPAPVRILGEDLVLWRDEQGRIGLMGRQCPHRGADLSFGRIEDGGLRCLYHGWLFDIQGRCLDMPAESPAIAAKYKTEVHHAAYPCVERGGLIFAYLGKGKPPVFPKYEFLEADDEHRFVSMVRMDCNYLQGLEGEVDPAHLSYLHRPIAKKDTRSVPGSDKSADQFYKEQVNPELSAERTDFGLRIYSVRGADAQRQYLRITNFIMPNKAAIVGDVGRIGEGYSVFFHVPIDDVAHWRVEITHNRVRPLDKTKYIAELETELLPDRSKVRNLSNRYLQDRAAMKTDNFNGMGDSFLVHDSFATESQGPIFDRSREFLGSSDKCIVAARRLLLDAIADVREQRDPLHVIRDEKLADVNNIVVVSEVIPKSVDIRQAWKERPPYSTAGADAKADAPTPAVNGV